ncbi:MAG: carboxypeptidase-like regulatory domain-containing protein [Candidatus Acidiferrales bacterium]
MMQRKHLLGLIATAVFIAALFALLLSAPARAQALYGSIRGAVTDQTGAVIPGVSITAKNQATGVMQTVTSGGDGSYNFTQLSIGDYVVTFTKSGFQTYTAQQVHLDVNTVYALPVKMVIGEASQQVTVEASPVQVNTSSPQLGVVITANQITNMPLLNRNWVNLQQLEPGVVAAADGRGEFATNGSETQQNSFLIDGTDSNDLPLNTRLIVPSPDAIAEFRMVSNVINPEYGRNSGAILDAVVKSGTNRFHGDAFEFYRDPFLNTRNFFAQTPAVFHQNEFGGTIGGPIIKNHTFFFFSYQGIHNRQPQGVGNTPVYTPAELAGNFNQGSDIDPATGVPFISESATTSPTALTGSNGTVYAAGTPYSTIFSCASPCQSGFIPAVDFNALALKLTKQFVPLPNVGSNYEFNPITTGTDNQYLFRIDQTFNSRDTIWGDWFQENHPSTDTLPFTGATLPGFGETAQRHFKFTTLDWTHVLNDHMVNELRGGYTRFNFVAVQPITPTLPSSEGFAITPQYPAGAGLPVINVTGLFSLGFSTNGPQPRIDQTYEGVDNLSLTEGRHTLKFGIDMRRFEVYNPFFNQNSGVFNYNGVGTYSTSNAGADFLLGFPDSFSQSSGGIVNARAQEYYSYVQDEFKLRSNFTLTYGLGWQIDTPINDNYYNNHAMFGFRPGQQSTVFPNSPVGYVFQGDTGVHAGGLTKPFHNFGPRFGFAYSPDWGRFTGGPGKTSIRGGFGVYYNRSEEEQQLQFLGALPFTISTQGVATIGGSPSFANPYVDVAGNGSVTNPFPYTPSANAVFTPYLPLFQGTAQIAPDSVDPMAENYSLTFERQLPAATILSIGYVGSVAHHLTIGIPFNLATNVQPCLTDKKCNVFNQPFTHPNDFTYPANVYGTIDTIGTWGNSNYNAFQVNLNKHLSDNLQIQAAYTYAHALDDGSGFENSSFGGGGFGSLAATRGSNPFNRSADYGNSVYDARHRLVIGYFYQIPGLHGEALLSRATSGWTIAGITTFQSGFPLDVVDSSFGSLTCMAAISDFACPDVPNLVGKIQYGNPRNYTIGGQNHYWFNPSAFAHAAPGTIGNAGRNLMRGPGINNWDFQLYKDTTITESTKLELRIEFYNVFNHTQFTNGGITTDINNPTFGQEFSAAPPREIQLAAKFYF